MLGASTEAAVDSPDLQQQQQPTTYKAAMPLAGSAAADASTNTGPIPFFSLREFNALQQELGPLGISNLLLFLQLNSHLPLTHLQTYILMMYLLVWMLMLC